MEQWSSYDGSVEVHSEQDISCGKGHRSSLVLQTGPGGRICLLCLSNLVSDKNAFLIHRTYAVEELSTALTDDLFCTALLSRHPQFLVTTLADAIGSSTDEFFCKGIMDVVLTLCRRSAGAEESLLQDFIRQTARQLGPPSLWSPSKCFTLHLIGLLFEVHCQQELCVPQAIKNQQDFVPNLVAGLELPGEALQGEILYVLYKLASLEDGIDELVCNSSWLCHVAIHALLKTESDALRNNCIALLSVMAGRSLFDIRLGGGSAPDRNVNVQSSNVGTENGDNCFARTFAEAMKGSLLSSDLQVQASALQLICLMFPEGEYLDTQLRVLVEEGIVDYVFEILRLSEKERTIQELAVDVLILISAEEHLFPNRFKFGLDTIIRVLEKSIPASSIKLQTSVLNLLSRNLSDLPGLVSIARAEQLLLLLTKILHDHAKLAENYALAGETNILPPTFNVACLALISLTQAPSCASVPNVTRILQTAATSAVLSASSETKVNPDPSSLKYSACLLQAVYHLNQRQILDHGTVDNTTLALIELSELYLLPACTDNLDNLDDENLMLAILQTFTLLLKAEKSESTHPFASRLASNRCFTLSFEVMARFPSRRFKESAYRFLSALVDKLAGDNMEAYVEEALDYLPADPADLLILLEQRTADNQQLLSAHHAIIAILSTSYSFNDRLAKETNIVASLEQHLLVNHGSALADRVAPEATLKQFVSLYATAKDVLRNWDASWSVEAEKILELVIGHSNCSDLLCSETSKPVLRWFLRKDSLKDFSTVQILTWFTAVENICSGDEPPKSHGQETGSHFLVTFAELLGEENCGTTVLLALFDKLVMQGVDDGIRIVAKTLTKLARINVFVGRQLVHHGFIGSVQQVIRLYESRALTTSNLTITSCLELLFQLLYDSDRSQAAMVDRSWLDIGNLCASLVVGKMNFATTFEDLTAISVINLILHKSYEHDYLSEACENLLCNRDLCTNLETLIIDASSQGATLSQMDSNAVQGELLCAAITFSLLRLRCTLRFGQGMDTLAHEVSYIGFQTSVYGDNGSKNAKFSATSLTCEHWSRILYLGPASLKMLACCCMTEIFSQLPDVKKSTTNNSLTLEELEMPNKFFAAVTMVLQGSILGDCEEIQMEASRCLYRLLRSPALSSRQKRVVASSPWNHILIENLILSLSTKNSGTCRAVVRGLSAIYIAVGLLKLSPPQTCISSIFTDLSITSVISNLSEDDIRPIIVSFFHELLLSRYLTNDHVRILRDLFQARRKTSYGRGPPLHVGDKQSNPRQIFSKILKVDGSTDQIIHLAILELAITCRNQALDSFCEDIDNSGTSQVDSCAFTAMLDSFMQDSYLQFQ